MPAKIALATLYAAQHVCVCKNTRKTHEVVTAGAPQIHRQTNRKGSDMMHELPIPMAV